MTSPMTARTVLGAAAAMLLAASLAAPFASAQTINNQLGAFGTQVKVGDFDYIPLTKRASFAVRALEADFGRPGEIGDNCILLLMDNTDSGAVRAVAIGAVTDVYTKDIRLTPCQGKPIGTAIADTDVIEQRQPYLQRAVEVRYFDVNNDGKFGRGDNVYLTTQTGANRGIAASTATGAWTIRLTPIGDKAPGTFVFPGDADFPVARATATGPTAPVGSPVPQARSMSLVEREGNGWYIIPAAVGFAAQQAIPVNSIRIGIVGAYNQQPLINPSTITLPDTLPAAGETMKITVKFSNDGTGAGVGLLVTKVDGQIVDARLTPLLAPNEGSQVVIPVPLPEHGGRILLSVGDSKVNLDIEGPAKSTTSLAPASADADLEARVAQLERDLADAQVERAAASATGIPAVTPLATMGLLGLAVLALRRRE